MKVKNGSRKESLGGSDAGAVVGLNDYQSRYDSWLAKVGEDVAPFTENKYTYWGTIKEKVVAEHYASRHGVVLLESPTRVRDSRPWMTGTPDRLIVAPDDWEKREDMKHLYTYEDPVSERKLLVRGLEIKTALEKHTRKWDVRGAVSIGDRPPLVLRDFHEADGTVPLYYWFQCQWYMNLMEFPEWDLCVLIGSSDYREYRLHYDEEFMHSAVKECEKFWTGMVETREPPPIDWGKMVNTYLTRKYTRKGCTGVIRDGDVLDNSMAKSLRAAGSLMKEMIEEEKELRAAIERLSNKHYELRMDLDGVRKDNDTLCNWFRDRIGKDDGVSTPSGTITWKEQRNGTRVLRKAWKKD